MAGILWWTAARRAALTELLAGGASYREAARALSRRFGRRITAAAVNRLCGRMGLHGRARGGRPRLPTPACQIRSGRSGQASRV